MLHWNKPTDITLLIIFILEIWKSFWKLVVSFTRIIWFYLNFIQVKEQHFQTFSESHSVICFSIVRIKQTFCIFRTCKRYACCLFWDSKKLHPHKHKTGRMTHEYWRDRKEELRKTGNKWKKLVTTSEKHRVKSVLGTSHWFIFSWTNSTALRNYRNETTCTYGRTKFLLRMAITGSYASHVRLMCKTYQCCPYLLTSETSERKTKLMLQVCR